MPSKKSPTIYKLRVIGGSFKRTKLAEVPGDVTRSTKDRVKESLFNMLAPDIPGAHVCDLFAGSGALGIEALSRGALHTTFIERNHQAFSVLRQNIGALPLKGKTTIYRSDALTTLKTFNQGFDVILIDPPYRKGLVDKALTVISENTLLNPQGIIAVLSENNVTLNIQVPLTITKDKNVGITKITLIEWSDDV